ncbi:MAG: hypothetical protein ACE5GX_15310 [Thermoanaerobaculia bacterium]
MPRQVKVTTFAGIFLIAISLAPQVARAQSTTGTWDIRAEVAPSTQALGPCTWTGIWQLTEDVRGGISGAVSLGLTGGNNDPTCPDPLTGTLNGTNTGGMLGGSITDTIGGIVTIDGNLAGAPLSAMGSFSTTQGAFAGIGGSWTGALVAPVMPDIPQIGLFALLLILFAGGSYLLLRRQRA